VNSNEQLKTVLLHKDKKGNTWFFNPVIKYAKEEIKENHDNFKTWKKF
jgi:hypothetical protein